MRCMSCWTKRKNKFRVLFSVPIVAHFPEEKNGRWGFLNWMVGKAVMNWWNILTLNTFLLETWITTWRIRKKHAPEKNEAEKNTKGKAPSTIIYPKWLGCYQNCYTSTTKTATIGCTEIWTRCHTNHVTMKTWFLLVLANTYWNSRWW